MDSWSIALMSEPSVEGLSVVMATYSGDSVEYLLTAGQSIFHQTRTPDELIVVIDGPVGEDHENTLKKLIELGNLRVVRSERNVGPGGARHQGILAAKYEFIAIMDADDICTPTRFEKQLAVFEKEEIDVVGGWIREFNEYPGDISRVRSLPESHEELRKLAKWRSPMNNVTAMFRKSAYISAGGFLLMRAFEDYDLYARMMINGSCFYNLQEVLVDVRSGGEMFLRRGGLWQIPIESGMLYRMYNMGFLNGGEFLASWAIRTLMRLLPSSIREFVYKTILRRR